MKYIYNDGGRSKYYKATDVNDCVARALAICLARDYKEVYKEISKVLGYTPRNGVLNKDVKTLMAHFGLRWVSKMSIGSGCMCHLRDNEVPMNKRIICNVTSHVVAVINGVINDTCDCSRNGMRCVYGYWIYEQ